jgi:Double-GTPase 2
MCCIHGPWLLPVIVVSASVCAAASEPADNKAPTIIAQNAAKDYVEKFVSNVRLEAEIEWDRQELDRTHDAIRASAVNRTMLGVLPQSDPELRSRLLAMLEQTSSDVDKNLKAAADSASKSAMSLQTAWVSVRASLYAQQQRLFKSQEDKRIAGQLASLLSFDNRWFWLCGLIAVTALVLIAVHERRHEVRRWLYGSKARAMGVSKVLITLLILFSVATATTFVFGDKVYETLVMIGKLGGSSPSSQMQRDVELVSKKLDENLQNHATIAGQLSSATSEWFAVLRKAHPDGERLAGEWLESRNMLKAVDLGLKVQPKIADQLEADNQALEKATADFAGENADRDHYQRLTQWIRGGFGAILLSIALGGGNLLLRGIRRRSQVIRHTCPLCLGVGTFAPLNGHAASGVDGDPLTISMIECKRQISDDPYAECRFTFPENYRDIVKLCFPTLGIPQVGKTHWLAMTYRDLNRGAHPASVRFERIKSASSDEFDRIVDDILDVERRIGPSATQTDRIPHPLVFHFTDHDRWERSHCLVNVFDYSGEVIRSHTVGESYQRRRALEADGFFFFLDPTEPSETQVQALVNFRDDLRLISRIKPGRTLRTPVALVVSKIDLMAGQAYAEGGESGAVNRFYQELAETGWDLSLKSIRARSRLMSELRDVIWPGWDIERSIDNLFGGRYMFFPVTPVGLNEPGERDLSRRLIAPVGLFHPLLWLLHMNGYQVLKNH